MPGVAGIISKHPTGNEAHQLEIMLNSMMHESFYTCAAYQQDELGVYAGIVALEGSFSAGMPLYNDTRDQVLLFSGECFSAPHDLLQMYTEQGVDFLSQLNGWFSGILIDISARRVVLFNDRYAAHKRIYLRETDIAWYFASEAKALLAILPDSRAFDLAALGEFFYCDCALDNKTYFQEISLLPNGSAWTFTNGVPDRHTYFDPAQWEALPAMEPETFFDAFTAVFEQAVTRCFEGSQPVGMSMTGGLDTRMVMGARHPAPGELPCYTFGGMYCDSLDVIQAQRVAKAFGQPWKPIRVDRAFLNEFASHASRSILLSDGLASVDITDEIYLNRGAREIAPVRLTGKFGSQLMRGVALLRKQLPQEELFSRDFSPFISQAESALNTIKAQSSGALSFTLFKELPWYWGRSSVAEATQLTVRSPFLDNDLIQLAYRAPQHAALDLDFQLRAIQSYDPRLLKIRTDEGIGGSAPPGLRYLGELVYYYLNTGDRLYNSAKMPHWCAWLDSMLAWSGAHRIVLGRRGFRHYRKWFRDELHDYVRDMLLDSLTLQRPYWDGNVLRQMVEAHTGGRANYFTAIRKALTVELIHRELLDRTYPVSAGD